MTQIYRHTLLLDMTRGDVLRDMADCYAMHRRVMSLFPAVDDSAARSALGVLYRLDSSGTVTVQSASKSLHMDRLPSGYVVRAPPPIAFTVPQHGAQITWSLVANPTKRTGRSDRTPGARVGLHSSAEWDAWIRRHMERAGVLLDDVAAAPCDRVAGVKPGHGITLLQVRFSGTGTVVDETLLTNAIRDGIGRGKAFGCGLLCINP